MPDKVDIWDDDEVANFWKHNDADFAGDRTAVLVARLSKGYTRGRVLDIGAGSGALLKRLPNATGIDLVPTSPSIIQASIADMPFDDASFDTAFATDVLEHLRDRVLYQGLREVRRVLRPGGHFICVVPYREDFRNNAVYCPHCRREFHRWGHMQVFSKERMRELLGEAGFAVCKQYCLPLGLLASQPWQIPAILALWLVRASVITPHLCMLSIAQ